MLQGRLGSILLSPWNSKDSATGWKGHGEGQGPFLIFRKELSHHQLGRTMAAPTSATSTSLTSLASPPVHLSAESLPFKGSLGLLRITPTLQQPHPSLSSPTPIQAHLTSTETTLRLPVPSYLLYKSLCYMAFTQPRILCFYPCLRKIQGPVPVSPAL